MLLRRIHFRALCTSIKTKISPEEAAEHKVQDERKRQKAHHIQIDKHFESKECLKKNKQYIPNKYFNLQYSKSDNLYLIDEDIAKKITAHVFPVLNSQSKDQIICETNAGLGLIASELLDSGIPKIRLYEYCLDFRESLKVRIYQKKTILRLLLYS